MIERDQPDDEDALWEISGLIGEHMPKTPADIKPAARRIAAVIAEYFLRYRAMVEEVKSVATVFYAGATGIMPGDPDPGHMSRDAAIGAAERLFNEIMAALEEDALQAIIDDSAFDERRLAKTGSLGHRVLSMLC